MVEPDQDENKCVVIANRNARKEACIVNKLKDGPDLLFCCCLHPMCNNFDAIPAILVKID